jgi:ubiquinone/menaquinone biosynthesis C-methylase UbiE
VTVLTVTVITVLAAASAVSQDGMVHGVDITRPMLDIARRRLAHTELGNVTFDEADVQTHALPSGFDIAISRFGTMFFDNPAAAFTNVRRSLY